MNKIRVAVCDDYEQDREKITQMCRDIGSEYRVQIELKQYDNGTELLFDLEDPEYYTTIDIILLDIHMPGPDGITVADRARQIGYENLIIFITESKEHYEQAFDVRGFNYITKRKGHTEERFEKVFPIAIQEAASKKSKSIVFSSGGIYKQIKIESILYFEVKRHLLTVYYGSRSFEFISTLNKLELQLEAHGFYRVQRSYLISLHYVDSFTYKEVIMKNGARIPIGRKYYKDFKEQFESFTLQQT